VTEYIDHGYLRCPDIIEVGENPIDRRRETDALAQACMSVMNNNVCVNAVSSINVVVVTCVVATKWRGGSTRQDFDSLLSNASFLLFLRLLHVLLGKNPILNSIRMTARYGGG